MRLLEGEKVVMELKPHPLAFMRYISLCIYYLAMGIFFYSIWGHVAQALAIPILGPTTVLTIWWILILVGPLLVGLFHITYWPLLCSIGVGILGTVGVLMWGWPLTSLGAYTVVCSIIGFFLVELYRRGHTYYITDQRLILTKRFLRKEERYLHYEHIIETNIRQGLIGQIFNFGTITPVTSSGLGVGQDFTALTVAAPVKRVGLQMAVTGGRTVGVPRARSYMELFGVPRPEEVRDLIERMRAAWRQVPYLRRIATATEQLLEISKKKSS